MTFKDEFNTMVSRRISPVLRKEGFKRGGRTFRKSNDSGDVAVIDFQWSRSSSELAEVFYVNLAIVPKAWWAWSQFRFPKSGRSQPGEADGLWRRRLVGPAGNFGRWEVSRGVPAEACASRLLAELSGTQGEEFRSLLEREYFLSRVRDGQTEREFPNKRAAELVVLLDEADAAEAVKVIDEMARLAGHGDPFTHRFVGWARDYLARHRQE